MTVLFLRLRSGSRLSIFLGRLFCVVCCLLAFPSVVKGSVFEASASGIISTKDRRAFPSLRANFPGRSPAWSRSRTGFKSAQRISPLSTWAILLGLQKDPLPQTLSQTPNQVWRIFGLDDFSQEVKFLCDCFPNGLTATAQHLLLKKKGSGVFS